MNKAQKRIWLKLVVSMVGLMVIAFNLAIIKIYNLDMADATDHTAFRFLGLICTIPLVLIVILDWSWKKLYDERDRQINHEATIHGIVGAFIFLAGAGLLLTVVTKMGSIKASLIISLVYLACFVWILVSSVSALIKYGWKVEGEKS
jgi:hypothetical protein